MQQRPQHKKQHRSHIVSPNLQEYTDPFQNHLAERTESECGQPQGDGPNAELINCGCEAIALVVGERVLGASCTPAVYLQFNLALGQRGLKILQSSRGHLGTSEIQRM
jgi:hypothetical protein